MTPGSGLSGPPKAPATGVVLGLFSDFSGNGPEKDLATREAQLHRTIGLTSHYYDFEDLFPTEAEQADLAAGRVPMITWWGESLTSMNTNANDDHIRELATRTRNYGGPIMLRFAAEMNGNWFSWSGTKVSNGPETFVNVWRKIHKIFADVGATNVAWVWAPNAESHPGGQDPTAPNSWRNYYPGDEYVDWVGIDGYNNGNQDGVGQWESFGSIFEAVYNDYNKTRPIIIAETSSVENGGNKADWLRDASSWIQTRPGIKAVVWFDTNRSSTKLDWRMDSSPAAWTAFTEVVAQPYWQARLVAEVSHSP